MQKKKKFIRVQHSVVMRSRERMCFLVKKFLEKPDLLHLKQLGLKIPVEVFELLMSGGQEIPVSEIDNLKNEHDLEWVIVEELLGTSKLPETHPYCGYAEPDYDTRQDHLVFVQ